jgi:glutamate synthase domain-containing protein 2
VPPGELTIGPSCRKPYTTHSLFNISGMSFGAISKPAIRALSRGAKTAGCWMNTGEGGLSPYHLEGGADIVFQIGTAKNGVRDLQGNLDDDRVRELAAHDNVRMFEIKMSQGAKPGKGGMLPGGKVTQEIATIRGIPLVATRSARTVTSTSIQTATCSIWSSGYARYPANRWASRP